MISAMQGGGVERAGSASCRVPKRPTKTALAKLLTMRGIADDNDDEESQTVLGELEKIDDDCDRHGIQFVKIDDMAAAKEFGIDDIPSLVYFEKEVPNLYDGDLENEDEILEWLVSQLESDEIEDVTDEMLDKMIKDGKTLAVLFCKYGVGSGNGA